MTMRRTIPILLLGLLLSMAGAVAGPAYAQATNAVVVSSCGTPPATYSAGVNRQLTQDTGGRLCNTTSPASGAVTATGSVFAQPSSSFTRPNNTTAYAVGNLVANDTTAGNVVPLSFSAARTSGGTGWIFKATLATTNTAVVGDTFVLHLYKTSPVPVNGDGGAWSTPQSGWICDITIVMNATAFTDAAAGQGVPNSSNACMFTATAQTIYGLVETRTAFTPVASTTYTASLEVQEN